MQRRIELLAENYDVTVFGRSADRHLKVGHAKPLPVAMTAAEDGLTAVKLGDCNARMQIAVRGERVYIHAFDRTFTLRIVDPVEQAANETGGRSNVARAPMPGQVVEISVSIGERVVKGQSIMIIESMKILTVIKAPRDAIIAQIHFEPGQTFDKNDELVTLAKEGEAQHATHPIHLRHPVR